MTWFTRSGSSPPSLQRILTEAAVSVSGRTVAYFTDNALINVIIHPDEASAHEAARQWLKEAA